MKKLKVLRPVFVLSYLDKTNRRHFLGAFPSQEEAAEEARQLHPRKNTRVIGYDARTLDPTLC